jgi:hypothetical protein
MDEKLLLVRTKSFLYSLLGFTVVGVLGFLASPDFANLIVANFGESAVTSLVLLVVPEVVKHIRNLQAIKQFGGEGEVDLI